MPDPCIAPKLKPGQFSLLLAELNTGIVLTVSGIRYLAGPGAECYRVFDTEKDVDAFALEYVKEDPLVECSIYDHDGNYLRTLTAKGLRKIGTVVERPIDAKRPM